MPNTTLTTTAFLSHLSVDGHTDWFCVLAGANGAIMCLALRFHGCCADFISFGENLAWRRGYDRLVMGKCRLSPHSLYCLVSINHLAMFTLFSVPLWQCSEKPLEYLGVFHLCDLCCIVS